MASQSAHTIITEEKLSKDTAPVISVILPVYNTEAYVREAVQSILNQTYTQFELIIINDASTDGTLQVLQSFNDSRIKVITNQTNEKVVRCLNKGLDLARGQYIARMDADDIAMPQRFEKQLNAFGNDPSLDVCATWAKAFQNEEHGFIPHPDHDDLKASLLFHNVIIHPTVMFRKKTFDKYQVRYEETFTNAEDYGLWTAVIDKMRFAVVPQVLLMYRIHGNNVSVHHSKNWDEIKRMNYMVYKSFLSRLHLHFSEQQLNLHLVLGFNLPVRLKATDVKIILHNLSNISAANKKYNYFNKLSLQNEIIKKAIGLISKSTSKVVAIVYCIIWLFKTYTLSEILLFIPYRYKKGRLFIKYYQQPENVKVFATNNSIVPVV